MSRTQVHLWYNRFKEDREDVNDNARPGRQSLSTTDENIEVLHCFNFYLAYRSAHVKQFLWMF